MSEEKNSSEIEGQEPQLWFSTQIWAYHLSDFERINTDILKVMQIQQSEIDNQGLQRSNVGGWHSLSTMHKREDMTEITHAISMGCAACAQFLKFDFEDYELAIIDMWINRNGPGDLNKIHIHPHSMLSGVYYVQIPTGSGNIEFLDPVIARTATTYPKAKKTQRNASTAEFEPVEGRLIIFPSWLQHWVQPNRGTEDRVSISFNVGYQPIDRSTQPR